MNRRCRVAGTFKWFGLAMLALTPFAGASDLLERRWFEARTSHFHAYSCGSTQEVFRLAGRLEQFREAYALLTGGEQAVASPPIVVMAFPDHAALEPFLPRYQDQPANLAAFFSRGVDENLIALSLSDSGSNSLQTIFHEYAHLLLRRNERIWPLWLVEGMADVYATFEPARDYSVRLGKPLESYVRLLQREPLRPLPQLFAVTRESPDYNEREHQGSFYAESWLLTHYLMLGDNPARKAQFGRLTALLRQGKAPEQAFTNALHTSLAAMEKELHLYLQRGQFKSIQFSVKADLFAPQAASTRALAPVEVCFRLGDQLLRVGQLDAAAMYFQRARKMAPSSPLPYEGLGLLAARQDRPEEAVQTLAQALHLGSSSFLAHYAYAHESFRLTAAKPDPFARLEEKKAVELRSEIEKSLKLMPDFGPAHYLLGCLEMVQGENLGLAEQQLLQAIQLEPEKQAYLLAMAQLRLKKHDPEGARRTLESLRRPEVEAPVRAAAEELLQELAREKR
jgi:tetratricopeptide (TPR) repeat protein